MGFMIFISGPSGVGKSTISKLIADKHSYVLFKQDDYFIPNDQKPRVVLSDGSEARNWDTYRSLDMERFNEDILRARFYIGGIILVEGFSLEIMKVVPDIHIHLSYVDSERVEDIALNNVLIAKRMIESRKLSKPNIKNDHLMVREIVLPHYLDSLPYSRFTYVIPTYIGDDRIPLDQLLNRIERLIFQTKGYLNFT
jgi:cytidylate kinase